jgi:hypothetical protein
MRRMGFLRGRGILTSVGKLRDCKSFTTKNTKVHEGIQWLETAENAKTKALAGQASVGKLRDCKTIHHQGHEDSRRNSMA